MRSVEGHRIPLIRIRYFTADPRFGPILSAICWAVVLVAGVFKRISKIPEQIRHPSVDEM